MWRILCLVAAFIPSFVTPAAASDLTDWNVSPLSASLDDWTATLGGSVSGAGYWASQSEISGRAGITGFALVDPRIEKSFDNGWQIGVHGVLLPWHDGLSGDIYGDRFVEKAYLSLVMQYGQFELGQDDGAAFKMAVTGPSVDQAVAIDEADVTFWRNPSTNKALVDIFRPRTGEFATENFGKVSYYSPRLFGVRIGVSYTPGEARDGLPFLGQGPNVPDRQGDIVEAAVNYSADFGAASVALYSGVAAGRDLAKTPDHEGLFDWGSGGEFDYDFDDIKFALGGGYRQSNAYTFDIDDAFRAGLTRSLRLGTTAASGPWIAGMEFSHATADGEASLPGLTETGYEPSVAYVVNSNLQLTLGWQHLRYVRDSGVFYDAKPSVAADAVFLHLQFHV